MKPKSKIYPDVTNKRYHANEVVECGNSSTEMHTGPKSRILFNRSNLDVIARLKRLAEWRNITL